MESDFWQNVKAIFAAVGTGAVVGFVLVGLFDLEAGPAISLAALLIGSVFYSTSWFGLFRRK